jgi:hypothetical protein
MALGARAAECAGPGRMACTAMETREILLKADKVSVVFERLADGKIRVTTTSWDDAKVILPNQVVEGCNDRQAGRAGPARQADRVPGHRRDQSSPENV